MCSKSIRKILNVFAYSRNALFRHFRIYKNIWTIPIRICSSINSGWPTHYGVNRTIINSKLNISLIDVNCKSNLSQLVSGWVIKPSLYRSCQLGALDIMFLQRFEIVDNNCISFKVFGKTVIQFQESSENKHFSSIHTHIHTHINWIQQISCECFHFNHLEPQSDRNCPLCVHLLI